MVETNEEKMKRLQFYHELLYPLAERTYPFFYLVMEKSLTKQEVEEIFELCERLQRDFNQQKEEGFVYFLPLLLHFVGMLHYKLDPYQTICALYRQGLYLPLMDLFFEIMNEEL